MGDTVRRSLLRRTEDSCNTMEPSFADHSSYGYGSSEGDGCCRLCCSDDCDLRELFPGGYKEEVLLRKILECTTVQITHDEDSDALICFSCVGKVEEFFQYREQCRSNDVLQRKWKRRLGRRGATTSTLIPVVSIKKEVDETEREYYGTTERLVPVDVQLPSISLASSVNVGSTTGGFGPQCSYDRSEHGGSSNVDYTEPEPHNLLELMPPEQSFDAFTTKCNDRYGNKSEDENELEFEVHVKQEPEDIDDEEWKDMEDSDENDDDDTCTNTALIPVIEGTAPPNAETSKPPAVGGQRGTTPPKPPHAAPRIGEVANQLVPLQRQVEQTLDDNVLQLGFDYKLVRNSKNRLRLCADGHMFVRDRTRSDRVVEWRCRKNYDRCTAMALQSPDGRVNVVGKHEHTSGSLDGRLAGAQGTFAFKFVLTAKLNRALVVDGYRYQRFYDRADGTTLWRCANAPRCKVKVSLEADGKVYVKFADAHYHERTESPVSPTDTAHNQCLAREGKVFAKDRKASDEADARSAPKRLRNVSAAPVNKSPPKSASPTPRPTQDYQIVKNKKGFKALVHKGYRYCKARVRMDGSIKWLCKMNRKTCNAGLNQFTDGRLEWVNASRHNHDPSHADEQPASPRKAEKPISPSFHIDEHTFVNSEWYYVRNRKNGTNLMHAGYQYYKKGERADSSSLWRCSRSKQGCGATILMYSNETIAKFYDVDHNHPPEDAAEQPLYPRELDDSFDQSINDDNGSDADDADVPPTEAEGRAMFDETAQGAVLVEQDDPDTNMRSLLNLMLDVSEDTNAAEGYDYYPEGGTVLSAAEAGYKFIQNRRLTQSLLFRGYRYCKNAPRADGSIMWICQMNKKTCRASVKTLQDGSLELVNVAHNHSKLKEDAAGNKNNSAADDTSESTVIEGQDEQSDGGVVEKVVTGATSTQRPGAVLSQSGASFDYYYSINRNSHTCLIFQRCRYCKARTRADGGVIWRCLMAGRTCFARATVYPDGSCVPNRKYKHNHPPLKVMPPAVPYPGTGSSASSSKENASPESPASTPNTLLHKQHRWVKAKQLAYSTAMFKCIDGEECPAVLKVKQNGTENKILYESPHNHAAGSAGPTRSAKPFAGYDGAFQLYRTNRGQLTLVYREYRYSLRNRQVDGTTSWKCRANKCCGVQLYIKNDGSVVAQKRSVESLHNHDKNGHTMASAERIIIDDGTFANLAELVENWFGGRNKPSPSPSPKPPAGAKTLRHGDHTYQLVVVQPGGREYWRCALFQTKACRAALFCRQNGQVVEHSNGRQHTHKPSEHQPPATSRRDRGLAGTSSPAASTTAAASSIVDAAGTREFERFGRNGNTIAYKDHRYCLTYRTADGFGYYRCTRYQAENCSVTIKMDTNQKIFPHTGTEHAHLPFYTPTSLVRAKEPTKKLAMMANLNAGPGDASYTFVRSPRGTSLHHQGYRYWAHNARANGWTVYRCRLQRYGCPGTGYLHQETKLFHLREDTPHTHTLATVKKANAFKVENRPTTPESERMNYSFMKAREGKFMLFYEDQLYEFQGKRQSIDGGATGCNFRCQVTTCSAAVALREGGQLEVVRSEHSQHAQPDLRNVQDFGSGSSNYKLAEQTRSGGQILLFDGHRYSSLIGARSDGSSRFFCQAPLAPTKVGKNLVRKRCFVPLIMFPNGRVATDRQHQHPRCDALEVRRENPRYRIRRRLPNPASAWNRLTQHPPSGSSASSTAAIVESKNRSLPPCSTLPAVSMSEFEKANGRRSFWYAGNRFYFFITRANGAQFWRCSWRIDRKCRAGLLRLLDGSIVPFNNECHSHPDQEPGRSDSAIAEPPGAVQPRDDGYTNTSKPQQALADHHHHHHDTQEQESTDGTRAALKPEEGAEEESRTDEGNGGKPEVEKHSLSCNMLEGGNLKKLILPNIRIIAHTIGHDHDSDNSKHERDEADDFKPLPLRPASTTATATSSILETDPSLASARENSYLFPGKRNIEGLEVEDPDDFLSDDGGMHADDSLLPAAKRARLSVHKRDKTVERESDDDGASSVDAGANDEQGGSAAWFAVELEETIESSSYDDSKGEHITSLKPPLPQTDKSAVGEEKGEALGTGQSAGLTNDNDSAHAAEFRLHPTVQVKEDDDSNDESECHAEGRTKELVVSAEAHESYARKTSCKKDADDNGGAGFQGNQ